ncbi:DNA circularization protein [Ursidibacter arcticus]
MGWTVPLQRASFRGVRFDVINVTDSFERVLAEHAYPFVNGADLEDMGLQPRRIQMQAVFFGEGYRADLDRLVNVLQKQGADVLVHPIFGRMQNMICQSASLRHGDEFVDYVALDLSFCEATPVKPLFLFENSLLSKIDELISLLEDFIDDVMAFYAEMMKVVAFFHNIKSRLLKAWAALTSIYESVLDICNVNSGKYRISSAVSSQAFVKDSSRAVLDLNKIVREGLAQVVKVERNNQVFSARSQFDEALRLVARIKRLSGDLVSGKNETAKQAKLKKSLVSSFSASDVAGVECALALICATELAKVGVELIEANAEIFTPGEIEYIAEQVRSHIAEALVAVRKLQAEDLIQDAGNQQQLNTGVYALSYQVIERLRHLAHQVSFVAVVAINRKPPLIVRYSTIDGTLQQVAHAFYGDYRRASELLRLNPHITQPNFIQQGDLINAYTK